MIQVVDTYYCVINGGDAPRIEKDTVKAPGNYPREIVSGLYVFNLQRMISDGEIELYLVKKTKNDEITDL